MQAFLAACSLPLDAAVDCYGAFVAAEPPKEFPLAVKPILGLAGDLSRALAEAINTALAAAPAGLASVNQ